MKAVSIHQPHASLLVTRNAPTTHGVLEPDAVYLAPMVKRWETRSWPCPPALIDQPVAFHAAQENPIQGEQVGDWTVTTGADGYFMRPCPPWKAASENLFVPLPLGAIVGSGRITACLPIVDRWGGSDYTLKRFVTVEPNGTLLVVEHGQTPVWHDISDQLPYGDFTPGRYAWQIEDAALTIERCPWCWLSLAADIEDYHCAVCGTARHCDPIPVKGHQRIWDWDPS